MMRRFRSRLRRDLEDFLVFKRAHGFPYRRAEYTLRQFDRFLCHHFRRGSFRLDRALLAWLGNMPEGRKSVSTANEVGVIRQFCKYLRRRDPGCVIPGRIWAPQSTTSDFVPYVLTGDDVRTLLRLAGRLGRPSFRRRLYRGLLLVLYCTGIRFGEALRLRIADVDLRSRTLFVAQSKGRSRWVPFRASLARELASYLDARRRVAGVDPTASFFVGASGKPLSVTAASCGVRGLLRAAGLKPAAGRQGPRPYDLRHAFAVARLTRWYRAGVDLHARLPWLSAYMGHDDILGTEAYLTATPELLSLAGHRLRKRCLGTRGRV